jgi:anti-sigma factor RsiW
VLDLAPAFVLGALEEPDMAAVRAHLATCPAVHAEVAELGGVAPYLAASLEPVEPSAGLKSRIIAAVEAERGDRSHPAGPIAPELARPVRARLGSDRQPAWRPRLGFALAAATVLAIAVLGAWNLALQRDVSELTAYREGVVAVLDAAAAPGSQLALLAAGEASGPRGLAAVRSDGTVVLAMRDLAPTTGSQVYETWVIAGTGTPVPVGGFTVGPNGTATFTSRAGPVAPGAVVALTLEPAPGATTPTPPIVSKGVAGAPPA